MSETLRWILIAFSIVLLACIYWWGRRGGQAASSDDARVRSRPEPRFQTAQTDEPGVADEYQDSASGDAEPYAAHSTSEYEPVVRHRSPEPHFEPASIDTDDADSNAPAYESGSVQRTRGRIEPTYSEQTTELTEASSRDADENAPDAIDAVTHDVEQPRKAQSEHAPTLTMSSAPAPRRIERRKIVALRLAAGAQRFDGGKLRAALESGSLQHGKYEVFHRLHSDGVSIFSVASMVEPGTFELQKMGQSQFPGVTLFAQLPGPVPGMHALNELVACARSLHQALGGTLQDERGVPLTVHRVERLRQEVRDFERASNTGGAVDSPPAQPAGH